MFLFNVIITYKDFIFNCEAKIQKLQDTLKQLIVSVENYPQLKSDETMVTAMETYSSVEENKIKFIHYCLYK